MLKAQIQVLRSQRLREREHPSSLLCRSVPQDLTRRLPAFYNRPTSSGMMAREFAYPRAVPYRFASAGRISLEGLIRGSDSSGETPSLETGSTAIQIPRDHDLWGRKQIPGC